MNPRTSARNTLSQWADEIAPPGGTWRAALDAQLPSRVQPAAHADTERSTPLLSL